MLQPGCLRLAENHGQIVFVGGMSHDAATLSQPLLAHGSAPAGKEVRVLYMLREVRSLIVSAYFYHRNVTGEHWAVKRPWKHMHRLYCLCKRCDPGSSYWCRPVGNDTADSCSPAVLVAGMAPQVEVCHEVVKAADNQVDQLSYQHLLQKMPTLTGLLLEAYHTLSQLEDRERVAYEPQMLASLLWAQETGTTGDLLQLMGDKCMAEARRIFDHLGVHGSSQFCASKLCELAASPPPDHATSSVPVSEKKAAEEVLRASLWVRKACSSFGLRDDCGDW
jgi:hypothetical protein